MITRLTAIVSFIRYSFWLTKDIALVMPKQANSHRINTSLHMNLQQVECR